MARKKPPAQSGATKLGVVNVAPLRGDETFHNDGDPVGFDVLDFWRWTGSNLLSSTSRGNLAEFMVGRALGLVGGVRATWEEYDLVTSEGARIEVKSSSYIQVWGQEQLSRPTFGIAPTRAWDKLRGRRAADTSRHADLYVFCLLNHLNQATLDPRNVSQWSFRVLPTDVLNRECPDQKTIGWERLATLGAVDATFQTLREVVSDQAKPVTI